MTRKTSPSRRGTRARAKAARGASSSRGARSFLAPVLVMVCIVLLGWLGTPEHRRSLRAFAQDARSSVVTAFGGEVADRAHAPAPIETWIDPAAFEIAELAFESSSTGEPVRADERWVDELAYTMGEIEAFRVDDQVALAELRDAIEQLSFVREVPLLLADAELGLQLELELREPVACIPVGDEFLTVDGEGVVLSGKWSAPIRIDGIALPVVGPMADAFGVFGGARPGDWLSEREHLDALDVALSMREHLDVLTRERLGRIVVDASRARVASVEEPGVRLLLEDRRLVLFGREPSTDEPGELWVEWKWAAVRDAIARLFDDRSPVEWATADVRWDRPELGGSELLAALTEAEDAPAERHTRVHDRAPMGLPAQGVQRRAAVH